MGLISAFIVYAKQFSRPINELAQIYGQLQTAIAGAERVFVVLDEADEEFEAFYRGKPDVQFIMEELLRAKSVEQLREQAEFILMRADGQTWNG